MQHNLKVFSLLQLLVQNVGQLKQSIDMLLKPAVAFRSPHEPKLEHVHVSTALDRLVTRVVLHVIVLVLLEQVAGIHLIATLQYALFF